MVEKITKTKKITKISAKPKKTVAKITGSEIPAFNLQGESQTKVAVGDMFKQKLNSKLTAQALRVYQSAFHQGTFFTKTRGEVIGSTRKIYKQKGTGRARHGDIKAPIFVGGGKVFGPKPRNFKLNLNKKMRQQAVKGILSDRFTKEKIKIIKGFKDATGKTKEISNLFEKLGINGKKILIILTPDMKMTIRAASNIDNVRIRPAGNLSMLDIINKEYLVIAYEALENLNQLFKK